MNKLPELQKEDQAPVFVLSFRGLDRAEDFYNSFVSKMREDKSVTLELLRIFDYEFEDDVGVPASCNVYKDNEMLCWIYNFDSVKSIIIESGNGDVSETISYFSECAMIPPIRKQLDLGVTRHTVSDRVLVESIIGYQVERYTDHVLPDNISRFYLDDALIGIASLDYWNFAYDEIVPTIKYIETLEPHQGKGYGSMLLRYLEKQSLEQGFNGIGVDHVSSPEAAKFFEKNGYYRGYTDKQEEDIIKRLPRA